MKVADSSFLIEALLRDATLLADETFISPDLALYEVVNTIWKHETLIRDLKDAGARIELFADLISSQKVQLIRPDRKLLVKAHALSVKHKIPLYDTIFVALALQLGSELKTFDTRQSAILSEEKFKLKKLLAEARSSAKTHGLSGKEIERLIHAVRKSSE